MDAEYIDGKDNVKLYPAGSWIWSNNGKSVFALKTEAYPLTALLAGMSDVEKAVEQVSDFTLRFASLLGDATSVKANGEFTSNNVTREVILTGANFTLTDALGDTFYLFDGVKSDGNVDKRSDMNLRQGFEEGTEGFETDFTLATTGIKAYYYKNGVKQNIPVTVGAEDTNATLVTNENTKTRAWEPGSISATDVIVTDLPAAEAIKAKGLAAIPGGVMIQLPSFVGTTEPVTIEFELIDVFGVTKTLSVTVKAAK